MVPLADKYPEQAMSRFESGQFPINAASKMAYVKAASALGRMDQVDVQVHNPFVRRTNRERERVLRVSLLRTCLLVGGSVVNFDY